MAALTKRTASSATARRVAAGGLSCGGPVGEELECGGSLLGYDAVAEGLQLGGPGEAGNIRDVAGGESLHPLDEGGC